MAHDLYRSNMKVQIYKGKPCDWFQVLIFRTEDPKVQIRLLDW